MRRSWDSGSALPRKRPYVDSEAFLCGTEAHDAGLGLIAGESVGLRRKAMQFRVLIAYARLRLRVRAVCGPRVDRVWKTMSGLLSRADAYRSRTARAICGFIVRASGLRSIRHLRVHRSRPRRHHPHEPDPGSSRSLDRLRSYGALRGDGDAVRRGSGVGGSTRLNRSADGIYMEGSPGVSPATRPRQPEETASGPAYCWCHLVGGILQPWA